MIYFYAQLTNEEVSKYENIRQQQLYDLSKDQIYIDCLGNSKWDELKEKIGNKDILCVESIGMISLDTNDFLHKLRIITEKGVRLYDLKKKELHIEEIIETVNFLSSRARYKDKMKQMEGIERSLEKKKQGEGAYGRPRVKVPDDFQEKLRYMVEQKISLESYRKTLDIKRSTFYRLVREVKDSWKRET